MKKKVEPRFIKVVRSTDPANWWNRYEIIGNTYEVIEVSKYGYAKFEFEPTYFGWIPLEMCEVNPHLKIVQA